MNIDLDSQLSHNDPEGLRAFMLVHQLAHQQVVEAIQQTYGTSISTFGLTSSQAEQDWINLMKAGQKVGRNPEALEDWLQMHAAMHTREYQVLLASGTVLPPDLSIVDFSSSEEFYDWMFVHQELHDFENLALGLT